MPTNDFLTFAASGGANVISQADYAAAPTLATGFQSGLAPSASVNKPIRQASIMAAVLAQFIADETGANSVDDGTTATLLANLKTAIIRAGGGRPGHTYTTNDWAWIDEPGGLIIQWGIFSIAAPPSSYQNITFPISFLSSTLAAWTGVYNSAAQQIGILSPVTTGMTIIKGNADTVARTGYWFAFGV